MTTASFCPSSEAWSWGVASLFLSSSDNDEWLSLARMMSSKLASMSTKWPFFVSCVMCGGCVMSGGCRQVERCEKDGGLTWWSWTFDVSFTFLPCDIAGGAGVSGRATRKRGQSGKAQIRQTTTSAQPAPWE